MTSLFARQDAYIEPAIIQEMPIVVIGVGSVGSNLADVCMKVGFTNITLCDYDKVELHNLPNQRFKRNDIGRMKVDAMNDWLESASYQSVFVRPKHNLKDVTDWNGIVFSCVDSMTSRQKIYSNYLTKNAEWKLFVDIRVGLFKYSIIIIKNTPEDLKRYEASLNPEVKPTGRVCGMETIINGVIGASNHAVQKALQWLRGDEVPYEVFVDVENDVIIPMRPNSEVKN